jgi:hypothetical protein
MKLNILSTYLPTSFNAQYWFINGSQEYFVMEDIFEANDFLLIDIYHTYLSEKETIDTLCAFLIRLDTQNVQWLLHIPDNKAIRELFSKYHIHLISSPRYRHKVPAIYVTNYLVTK